MTLEQGAAEAEVKIRTPRHALVWRLALGVCWLAWAGAMQREHRVLFALIWLFISGATVATAIWYRTFGIDLTRDAAIVRSFRRHSIPWREVQAVVRDRRGGPSGGGVELIIDGGKPVLSLDAIDYSQRLVPRAAASAVSDGAKVRLGFEQRGNRFLDQIAVALVRFRRKKFKRNHRLAGSAFGGVDVSNQLHECANHGRIVREIKVFLSE